MTEKEFKKLYNSETPILLEWGKVVKKKIVSLLSETLGMETNIEQFIKIPITIRVKEVDSIISKAFYRNKKYTNPYLDITDKVGLRVIVLLINDIEFVNNIIESSDLWFASKDRDFEEERKINPLRFDYQSVHYILRNREEINSNGLAIPADTPCEIQIRTILQHAYSELTHDTIYKPQSNVSSEVLRSVARSMALIETTDNIFQEVDMVIKKANRDNYKLLENLTTYYNLITKSEFEPKMNYFILDSYKEVLSEIKTSDIEEYLAENVFLNEIIKQKFDTLLIYRQPIILFIYYLINKKRIICKKKWPLTEEELRPFFTDLGIAFERI